MTKITFYRQNGIFWGFQETGHTGFGEEGDDILCSAISAMTMLILNTIEVAYKISTEYSLIRPYYRLIRKSTYSISHKPFSLYALVKCSKIPSPILI